MKTACKIFNYEYYYFRLNNSSSIQNFLYYLVKSNAVITDSYHGTVFSILFNKPFITIYNKCNAKERFNSIGNLFNLHERFIEDGKKIDFKQLIKSLNINNKLLNELKLMSINFIKRNLEL